MKSVSRSRGFPAAALTGLLLGGCATAPLPPAPQPFSAEATAGGFAARSLRDEGLHRFLVQNLGHDPSAWDFESLSWVSFYYHPSLELARAQWTGFLASEQTATARPNPTISLVPGYNTTRVPGVSPWFPAVNFDFLLQGSSKRAHQADLSRAESEAGRLEVLAAAWQVRGELRRALLDLDLEARRVALLQVQADAQKKILELTEQRLAAGGITAVETSTARMGFMKTTATLAEARTQLATARVRVATALGLPVVALEGIELPVPSTALAFSAESLASARRLSLQSRADILAALAHYQSAQAALELEVAKQQPDIHLGPGYQWDQGANKWSLALTFELPLFHRNEGPIAEAVARRAAAAAQLVGAQAQAIAAIDTAVAQQSAAVSQWEEAQKFSAEVRRQAGRARERLKLGAADQLEFQSAQLDLTAGEIALNDAEAAAAQAAGQLEDALQVPFPNLAALADPAHASLNRLP